MHRHGPKVLAGPVSRKRSCWKPRPASKRPHPEAPVRQELVERVRREIAAGTYETSEKWEAALDRLFERLSDE